MISEEQRTFVLSSLDLVGRSKAVGYLPLYTIRDVLGLDLQNLIRNYSNNQTICYLAEEDNSCIKSGALYVYHQEMVKRVLKDFEIVLERYGWDSEVSQIIVKISERWFAEGDILRLIKSLFGE